MPGLKERRSHLPSELSGGPTGVSIGRALINKPSIILQMNLHRNG